MSTSSQVSIKTISGTLAQCFFDDPSFTFILGERSDKLMILSTFFELLVDDGMERGRIEIAPDEQGICLWYPADIEIFNQQFEQRLVDLVLLTSQIAGEKSAQRLEQILQKIGDREPKQPHCEVFYIGIKPTARGKGIGKSLLQPVLDYADTTKVGCYLISSNSRNLSFYERSGFRQIFPIPIDESYSMTGMWRDWRN